MPHLPIASPDDIGLNPLRLNDAYRLLEKWTNERAIPGGSILVGRFGKTVEPRFFGRMGMEDEAAPIRDDGIFLLASISKPVTYLAALQLVERGQLRLSDPVTRYIPDFAAHHKEETLVSQLFTHTSGMPDMLPNNRQLREANAPLSRFIQGAIRDTVPIFPAGTNLSYQSMGTLVVAELIQRISGKSIAKYLRDEVLTPLGMTSTALGSGDLPKQRLVDVEIPPEQIESRYNWNRSYWRNFGAPWGGMYSSPADFAVLCQCMLDDGRHAGRQLWSPKTIRMATTNRLDDYAALPEPIRRTQPWGLGWRMNHPGTAGSWGDLLDRHVFGHTGATGTMVWMDREKEGFCILFTTALRSKAPWRLVMLSNAIAAAFV